MANAATIFAVLMVQIRFRMRAIRTLAPFYHRHGMMTARGVQNLRIADEHQHDDEKGEKSGAENAQSSGRGKVGAAACQSPTTRGSLGLLSNSAARHAACLLALLAIAIITARSTWQLRAAAALPAVATVSNPTPTTAVSAPLAPVSDFVAVPPQTSDASSPVPTAALSQRSWREKLQRCVP